MKNLILLISLCTIFGCFGCSIYDNYQTKEIYAAQLKADAAWNAQLAKEEVYYRVEEEATKKADDAKPCNHNDNDILTEWNVLTTKEINTDQQQIDFYEKQLKELKGNSLRIALQRIQFRQNIWHYQTDLNDEPPIHPQCKAYLKKLGAL